MALFFVKGQGPCHKERPSCLIVTLAKTTVGSIGLKSICELANSVRHTRRVICFVSAYKIKSAQILVPPFSVAEI